MASAGASAGARLLEAYGGDDRIAFPGPEESASFFRGLPSRPPLLYRSDHRTRPYTEAPLWPRRYLLACGGGRGPVADFNDTILARATAVWETFKEVDTGMNALVMVSFGRDDDDGDGDGDEQHRHEAAARKVVLVGQRPDATVPHKRLAAAFANFIADCFAELGHDDVPVYVVG